jgi:GT2 family glycosyltransferase
MFSPDSYRIQDHAGDLPNADEALVDVSVVIVSYNTSDVTRQAVRSVLETAGDVTAEVIVVDNASSDGSAGALRDAFPGITVIDAGHNGGYARGNNRGIAEAQGRYILVLNPDALLHTGTLRTAVDYLDAHPDVGLLGGCALYETGAQQSTLFRDVRLSHLFWRMLVPNRLIRQSRWFGDQRYASTGRGQEMDVEIVAGCFMMAPRRVIARVGAMDDRFFMYSEESEWCWRVRQAGYRVRYHPQVRITHHGAVSTGATSPWKSVEIAKGQILFLRFTRSPLVAWAGTAIMLAGEALRGLTLLPASLVRRDPAALAIWKARLRFLATALVSQPRGQPPQADRQI